MLRAPALPVALRVAELADIVDARLPERAKKSWRWRILYIRAQIDKILYEYFFEHFERSDKMAIYNLHKTPKQYLAHSDRAQELLQELIQIYHCIPCPAEYKRVYPPIKERTIWYMVDGEKVVHDE